MNIVFEFRGYKAIGVSDADEAKLEAAYINKPSSFTDNKAISNVETTPVSEPVVSPEVQVAEPIQETNTFDAQPTFNFENTQSVISNEPVVQEQTINLDNAVPAFEMPATPIVSETPIIDTPVIPSVDPVEAAIENTVNEASVVAPIEETPVVQENPVFEPQTAQEFHEAEEQEVKQDITEVKTEEKVDLATKVFVDFKELVDDYRRKEQENRELKQRVAELEQKLSFQNTANNNLASQEVNHSSNLDPVFTFNQTA